MSRSTTGRAAAVDRAATGSGAGSTDLSSSWTVTAFSTAVLMGGTNFVAIRFSNRELEPLWGGGARFAIAAVVCAVASAALGLRIPRGIEGRLVLVYGLVFGATYGLLYSGMRHVSAGEAAVIMGAGPLLTLLLAAAHRLEQVHLRSLSGALLALVGTVVMFVPSGRGAVGVLPVVAVCLAAVAASESVVIARRCRAVHPLTMNTVAMGVGAAVMLAVSAATGEQWAAPERPATILAFGYLTFSAVVFTLLVLFVVRRWTASATSYGFVLMPPVALILGALLGGETITATTVLGGLLVIGGVYAGALRRKPEHSEP
jgi:drug/metabolite transporter (DMT)-like permease